MRPVVGITAYAEVARWGAFWQTEAAIVPMSYVRKVEQAGGRPVVVPPTETAVGETLDALDALVFTGGPDLDPGSYDAKPHPEVVEVRPERDRAELALALAARGRDMPVLAICRGSQIVNVALGGDLVQHLPEVLGHHEHKADPAVFGDHPVSIRPGSRLAEVLGGGAEIKSHHHQGFGRIGEGLEPAAFAPDGIVEALEDPARRFFVGVLWHPEAGDDPRLFEALVEAARAYRAARR